MDLQLITAPARLLTLEQAKQHLNVEHALDDALIDSLVLVATTEIDGREGLLRRALVTQTWDYRLPCFPAAERLELPFPPLQSVTHIKYFDINGVEQTLSTSAYSVNPRTFVGYVRRNPTGSGWPSTYDRDDAVTIRFVAGYGEPDDVPSPIKQSLLLRVAELYVNRGEEGMPPRSRAQDALLYRYRVQEWL